ncbi:MAG: metallophosphoesterase [Prevotellaceae bacterium]|jgi:predicted MPP superfamily phosphohydrolase|nr:metallophosphoesterase [Prevotellaceae bacterium]
MKFIVIFLLIILTYLGINGWLFHALLRATQHWPPVARITLSVAYWSLALLLFPVQMLRDKLPIDAGHLLYWLSNGWLVFFFYLALSYLATILLRLFGLRIPHAFACSVGFTLLLLVYGFIRFSRPVVRHINLSLSQPTFHPTGMRIVAVSDVHLGYGVDRARLRRYVDLINRQRPDLILIAGDLIDMSVVPLWTEKMQDELNRLQAPMGIYMVPGNHEYISGIDRSVKFIEQTRITLLRDSIVRLPNGIQLAGRDDRSNPQRKSLEQLLAQTDAALPRFVMDHQPVNETVDQLIDARIDFAFFGHTHHGQIWPMNRITDTIYRQSYGYHTYNHTHVYVSSGLGLWGPPFRIGTVSELVVIDF